MVEQKNSLQFVLLVSIMSVLLLAFIFGIYSVANAFTKNENSNGYFGENTWVGPILIEGLSKEQAAQLIEQKTSEWAMHQQTTVQLVFEETALNGSIINFLTGESINQAKSGRHNPLVVQINDEIWNTIFSSLGIEEYAELINLDDLKKQILEQAKTLQPLSNPIHLTQFFISQSEQREVLASETIALSDTSFGALSWVRKNGDLEVNVDETFSLNNIISADTEGLYNAQFQNELSSLLYKTALSSPMSVIERHVSTDNTFGREVGFEAFLDRNYDLVLKNEYGFPLTIETNVIGNQLTVSIYSKSIPIKVHSLVEEKKELTPRVIVRPITLDQQERKVPGKNGSQARVKRVVLVDSSRWKTLDVSLDAYLPVHEVWYKYNENLLNNNLDADDGSQSSGESSSTTPPDTVTEDKGYVEVDPQYGDEYVGK